MLRLTSAVRRKFICRTRSRCHVIFRTRWTTSVSVMRLQRGATSSRLAETLTIRCSRTIVLLFSARRWLRCKGIAAKTLVTGPYYDSWRCPLRSWLQYSGVRKLSWSLAAEFQSATAGAADRVDVGAACRSSGTVGTPLLSPDSAWRPARTTHRTTQVGRRMATVRRA